MAKDDVMIVGDGKVTRATDKAILVQLDGERPRWIPKSQLGVESISEVGDRGVLIVTRWFAEKCLTPTAREAVDDVDLDAAFGPRR